MNFTVDFSKVDRLEMKRRGIWPDEVNSILENDSSFHDFSKELIYSLGFRIEESSLSSFM